MKYLPAIPTKEQLTAAYKLFEQVNDLIKTHWARTGEQLNVQLEDVYAAFVDNRPRMIAPGDLIKCRGEWWRVVMICKAPIDGRLIIRCTSESGHSTDYWELEHIQETKPYDQYYLTLNTETKTWQPNDSTKSNDPLQDPDPS